MWVSLVPDRLAAGEAVQEILADYPGLEEADVRACIAYGAEIARERFVDAEPGRIRTHGDGDR